MGGPSSGFSQHTRGILHAEVRPRSASASLLLAACVSLAALVAMLVAVRSALLLGGFDDAAEARQWCDRLAALFKAPPLGPPP